MAGAVGLGELFGQPAIDAEELDLRLAGMGAVDLGCEEVAVGGEGRRGCGCAAAGELRDLGRRAEGDRRRRAILYNGPHEEFAVRGPGDAVAVGRPCHRGHAIRQRGDGGGGHVRDEAARRVSRYGAVIGDPAAIGRERRRVVRDAVLPGDLDEVADGALGVVVAGEVDVAAVEGAFVARCAGVEVSGEGDEPLSAGRGGGARCAACRRGGRLACGDAGGSRGGRVVRARGQAPARAGEQKGRRGRGRRG